MPWSKSLKGEGDYWEMEHWPFVPETREVTTPIWCCWPSLWWMAQKWAAQRSWESQWKWIWSECYWRLLMKEVTEDLAFPGLQEKGRSSALLCRWWWVRLTLGVPWFRCQRGPRIFVFACPPYVWKCESLSHVWLCNPMDYSLPGSSVHGILRQEYCSG